MPVQWGRVYEIVSFRPLFSVNPPLQYLELYDNRVQWGRVYEIVSFRPLFSVNPPLQYLELYDNRAIELTRSRLSAIENIAGTTRISEYTRFPAISPTLNYPI